MSRIVVVGAGFAGLAAAATLAARGHQVSIVEARPTVGGLACRTTVAGARVDLGPTILTDLTPLRLLAERLGVLLPELAALTRLDPGFLATFPGGVAVLFHEDPARVRSALAALGPEAAADWERIRDLGSRALRLAEHYYARGDLSGPRDLMRFLTGGGISLSDVLPFLRHGSLARLLDATVHTPALRRLLGHFARLMGADAETAPAVSLVIPHLLTQLGVWYPEGGIAALAETVARLAGQRGASVRLGEAVEGLDMSGGRVVAVRTPGGRLPTDACVCAVDLATTAGWIGSGRLTQLGVRLRPARTARVAWWLVEGRPPLAIHHAYHFGADPTAEPLYVALPALTDPALAPEGTSLLYALRHCPAAESPAPDFAQQLQAAVAVAGQWPSGRVLASGLFIDATSCYGYAVGASLFSARHPSQRVPGVDNLILAGKTVFPGPGVANVIRSGLRAADLAEAATARGAG
jgi:phytoene dehydrogenase-like protein